MMQRGLLGYVPVILLAHVWVDLGYRGLDLVAASTTEITPFLYSNLPSSLLH